MPSKYIKGGDIPNFYKGGPRVRVWGNLNERCMSLDWKGSGGVKWLQNHKLVLENPRFHVQPAGHRKIAYEGASRSVVARVSGDVVSVVDLWEKRHDIHARIAPPMVGRGVYWVEISYNPIDRGHLDCFHTVTGHTPVVDGMIDALVIKHDRGFNTRTNVRMWGLLV